jgi:hypothetical protein
MARHRRQFEEEHQALCKIQEEYERVISDYEAARVDFQSRLDSAEASRTAFESSVEGRLTLIESRTVLRAELERDYARKSALESDYLTKSEMETRWTAQAELQSDFLTKADANILEERCVSRAYLDQEVSLLKRVIRRFVPISDSTLSGIIHHLTLEAGGHVHDLGVVAITADRPYDASPTYAGKNVADFGSNSYVDSATAENMWDCYDFKDKKVALTDYSIRSLYAGTAQQLKSWVIEVSNDLEHWTVADRRENRSELCGPNVVRTYPVSEPCTGRYVRLRQIGVNSSGHFITCISAFELFGALTF